MIEESRPAAFDGERLLTWNNERQSELLAGLGGLRPYGSTGLASLDKLLGGGLTAGVHILSALPGAGKSTLALQIADFVARFGRGSVLYLSLEMSASSLLAKSLSRLSTEADTPLSFGDVIRLSRRADAVSTTEFKSLGNVVGTYFCEVAPTIATMDEALTVKVLDALYASLPSTEARPMLVVDYLQLIPRNESEANMSEYVALTATMRELCSLAQTYAVPVLAISSQNRGSKRGGTSLDALSGSSALEFGATTVSFLTVDGGNEEEQRRNAEADIRPVTLAVAKNRFGRLGSVPLWFDPVHSRFTEREGQR